MMKGMMMTIGRRASLSVCHEDLRFFALGEEVSFCLIPVSVAYIACSSTNFWAGGVANMFYSAVKWLGVGLYDGLLVIWCLP
jgi:hypothetical protein